MSCHLATNTRLTGRVSFTIFQGTPFKGGMRLGWKVFVGFGCYTFKIPYTRVVRVDGNSEDFKMWLTVDLLLLLTSLVELNCWLVQLWSLKPRIEGGCGEISDLVLNERISREKERKNVSLWLYSDSTTLFVLPPLLWGMVVCVGSKVLLEGPSSLVQVPLQIFLFY